MTSVPRDHFAKVIVITRLLGKANFVVWFGRDFFLQLDPVRFPPGVDRYEQQAGSHPLFDGDTNSVLNLGKNKVACCVKLANLNLPGRVSSM